MMLRPMRPNPLMPTLMAICQCLPARHIGSRGCVGEDLIRSQIRARRTPAHARPDGSVRVLARASIHDSVLSSLNPFTRDVHALQRPRSSRSSSWCRRISSIRRCATGSTSAACRSGWAICRSPSTSTATSRSGSTPCRSGEVLTARALLPQLRERYPRLRMFLSTTTMTGQQIARTQPPLRRRGVLLSASTSASS